MTDLRTGLLALALAGAPLACVAAEQTPGRQALKDQCTGDYMTHCSQHAPGGPEVEACFKANKARLSQGCNKAIALYQREQRLTKRQEAEAR